MTQAGDRCLEAGREIRQIVTAVSVCFVFSGATGLVYQVLWTRILGLVFGHTVFAITTVLAAFMAGLGLGSYLLGRVADRHDHLLRLYGLLEAGIGVYALLTPALFSLAEAIYIPLHRQLNFSFPAFSLSQFSLTFLVLIIPTTLMGATLPVMSRFFVGEIQALGGKVAWLYALNTFGAVLGAYGAGFHLIPVLGVRTSLHLAAAANIGIGLLAVVFDRHLHRVEAESLRLSGHGTRGAGEQGSGGEERILGAGSSLAVVGLGISGAASMIYEVAWTRALSLVIGSSTYAFSTMLVAFLTGLALGSYLFSRLAGRLSVDAFLFGILQLGVGLSALAVTPFFDRLPEVFLGAFALSQSPGFVTALQFTISALAMLLPTVCMGATFPCVAQIASTTLQSVGSDVGRIYFINTGGAIFGTVLAGFLFIPGLGLQPTLKLAVSTNLALALALFVAAGGSTWSRRLAPVVPLSALVILYVSPPWDAHAMVSGVAVYGRNYFGWLGKADFRETMASSGRLVYYKDGISTTVTVHQRGDDLFLKVNGKTDASNQTDMHTQLMSGHLPLLLHPDPRRALVIGLGSAITAGAVAVHPVDAIEAVEIEPAVVEAAGFFVKENRGVLRDPRLRLEIADGRNYLLASPHRYDVIISEPSNPWLKGIGNLFSREFYQVAAARLAPRGIMCQWLQGYGLFPEDLQMVIKTFRSVFPHTTAWETTPGDFLLIGSQAPLVLDYTRFLSRFHSLPALREDLARLGFPSPISVLADFALSEEDAARFSQHAWLNTDDLPLLEFSAPESLYANTLDLNRRLIREARREEFPPVAGLSEGMLRAPGSRRDFGLALLAKGQPEEALAMFEEALRLNPQDPASLTQRGKLYLRSGAVLKAEADFKSALRVSPDTGETHEALGQLYRGQRMPHLAETHLRKAVALSPRNPRFLAQLADLYREGQQFQEAIPLYLAALEAAPGDPTLWAGLGVSYQGSGIHQEALAAFHRAGALRPESSLYDYLSGLVYLSLRQRDKASAAFEAAARKMPARPGPHLELGRLYREDGQRGKSLEAFRRVLQLDPQNTAALRAVEDLSASPGDRGR